MLEPFGANTEYLGHAITASTIANVNRGKNQKAYSAEDFMPKFGKKKQTVEEMKQIASMLTMSMGGQDLREDKDDG
jgi:hypothetical protein